MPKENQAGAKSSMATSRKTGTFVRSAESRRMRRLANIPTVARRDAAVRELLDRAK